MHITFRPAGSYRTADIHADDWLVCILTGCDRKSFCIFCPFSAIFPAALLAVIGLLIFIVIVDVLIIGFCIYLRYKKKKKRNNVSNKA